MKVIIDIPNDFTGDYIVDKFKDFFSRVIADIDCKGMCGRYEKEIAEMFLKAFDDSEEKISCNCQHNSNSRDNEPCCRCDSKQTNADRIRNMSDEELAEWLTNMCDIERHGEPFKSIYNLGTEQEEEIHDSYGDLLNWLQSEAE
jgi:hypothetical protein